MAALIILAPREIAMKIPRRTFLRLAAGAAALPLMPPCARAQAYPSRPVRIIVGFTPGGSTDIAARLIGQWLSDRLGQQFIIENRPGAGASIAAEAVVRAPPDGYTLLLVNSADMINATLYHKLNFSLIRDIAPVASVTRQPQVMLANPSVPARTLVELVAYAKANPAKVTMASSGNGTIGHLAGELLKTTAGIDMIHVPYRGAGPALSDLLAGHVNVSFTGLAGSIEYARTGTVRALAVTTTTRSQALPDIPCVSELFPGYEAFSLFGIGAPRNTPIEIVEKLNREINTALLDYKIQARIADLGGTVLAGSPAEFGNLIAHETEKWAKVIRTANIKAE
jgi:tripartite-type tricarboxylate transporter receptor subunit TctC